MKEWHYYIILVLVFLVGALLGTKYPQLNVLSKVPVVNQV
jgi:hypothetical protein